MELPPDRGLKQQIERKEIYIHPWATIINHKYNNNSNSNSSKITACLTILMVEVIMDLELSSLECITTS